MSRFSLFLPLAFVLPASLQAQSAPDTMPGLTLWLDAQDAGTVTTSLGVVTQWDSKAGAGIMGVPTSSGAEPTQGTGINGFSTIKFDNTGTADGMVIRNGADTFGITSGSYDMFVVDQYWGASNGRSLQSREYNWLLGKWGGPSASQPTGYNSFYCGGFSGAGAGTAALPNVASITEGLNVVNGEMALLLNGKGHGWNGGGYAPGRLGISAGGLYPGEASQSEMGEIIAFSRVLSDVERRSLVNYLAAKWSLPKPFQGRYSTQTTLFSGGDPGEGLDFQGTFIAAVAMGTGVPVGQVIDNATFTDESTVSLSAAHNIPSWTAPSYGAGANDAALAQITRNIRYSSAGVPGAGSVQGTVSGLVLGRTYKAQFLFTEGCCANRGATLTINGKPEYKNFAYSTMPISVTPTHGVALVHQFTANSTSMAFSLDPPQRDGDRSPTLSGLTVEDLGIKGLALKGPISSAGPLPGRGADVTGDIVMALDMAGTVTGAIGDANFVPGDTFTGATIHAEHAIFYNRPELGALGTDEMLEDILHSIRYDTTQGLNVGGGNYDAFDFGRQDGVSVDIPNLTVGQRYKVQLLFSDANSLNRGWDIAINEVLVERNFSLGPITSGDNTQGAFWAYEFTADQTDLHVLLTGFNTQGFSDRNPVLSGLTLEKLPPSGDTDGDGLLDSWEMLHFGDLDELPGDDPDGDTLTNLTEQGTGTKPNDNDSDDDGLLDAQEINVTLTNPLNADTDLDGLADGAEIGLTTNPLDRDTDKDTLTDGAEVNTHGSDPLDLDSDNDLFNDPTEVINGSIPSNAASTPPANHLARVFGAEPGEGLDLNGNFVYAQHMSTEAGTFTVRDAVFANSTSTPGFSLLAPNQIVNWVGGLNYGPGGDDAALANATRSIRWANSDHPTQPRVNIAISNLIPGARYKVQMLFAEQGSAGRGFDVLAEGVTVADDFFPAAAQAATFATNTSSALVGEIVMADDTLNIVLDGNLNASAGDKNAVINAITVELLSLPSLFSIPSISRTPTEIAVGIKGAPNKTYAVDYSVNLGGWVEVSPGVMTSGSGDATFTDTLLLRISLPAGFYRLRDPVLQPTP